MSAVGVDHLDVPPIILEFIVLHIKMNFAPPIIRAYFRGERNSLAWEYYEGYFPFSHRLSANLILKSHKFHIFVIKRSVLGILHGNLSTHARQLTPKITAFDKSK